MKKSEISYFAIPGIAGFLLFLFLEDFVFQSLIHPSGSNIFIQNLYPGLQEKIRIFGDSGILDLVKQLKIRWLLLMGFGFYLFAYSKKMGEITPSQSNIAWRIKLFFVVQLIYLPDLLKELRVRAQWKPLYEPLPQFSFFGSSFPLEYYLQLTGVLIFGLTAVLVLAKWAEKEFIPLTISILIWLGWTFLLSIFLGFGKIDHTYATLYAGMVGTMIYQTIIFLKKGHNGLAFGVFQAFIWGCYFFSGMEKITLSGLSWISDEHFNVLCQLHPTKICQYLGGISGLGPILLFFGLAFQLLSCLQWAWPKWGFVTIICGILFHLGTWQIFDIGGWQSPWIVMLLFLWPMNSQKIESQNPT